MLLSTVAERSLSYSCTGWVRGLGGNVGVGGGCSASAPRPVPCVLVPISPDTHPQHTHTNTYANSTVPLIQINSLSRAPVNSYCVALAFQGKTNKWAYKPQDRHLWCCLMSLFFYGSQFVILLS